MTRLEHDPHLEQLGDALHATTTVDLAREDHAARSAPTARARHAARAGARQTGMRARAFAGGTLGLAGVGAALVIGLGGSAASPAFAKTRVYVTRQSNGSVLVKVDTNSSSPWVGPADRKLAAMGIDEQILLSAASGPSSASASGVIDCKPLQGADAPSGPPIRVLFTEHGTPASSPGNTGPGNPRVNGCAYFKTAPAGDTGAG